MLTTEQTARWNVLNGKYESVHGCTKIEMTEFRLLQNLKNETRLSPATFRTTTGPTSWRNPIMFEGRAEEEANRRTH